MRDFDISSIYFFKKGNEQYDCIDGRQRINAILSFVGINDADIEDNKFHLKMENEIYDDEGYFNEIDKKRFSSFNPGSAWRQKFLDYKMNIVEIVEVDNDEELNLLFLRLQIASILNAGEKLHAMTGDMRQWIFYTLVQHEFIKRIKIPQRRYAKEQVAAQIALNVFSKQKDGTFQRSRYVDLQDFFKRYNSFSREDKKITKDVENVFSVIVDSFGNKLRFINNRAIAVSIYLFMSEMIESGKQKEIAQFVEFFIKFWITLKWQTAKGINMDKPYQELLNFQTNIAQAAGEKTSIQKRHDFLSEYFYFYKENNFIKGDKEYKRETRKDPDSERSSFKLR